MPTYYKKKKVLKKKRYNNKRRVYRRPQKYPNARAISIQRADLVPRTKLVEMVFDNTYLMRPEGTKGNNTMGLCFNLTDLFSGPAATIQPAADPICPFWGAYNIPGTVNQSGDQHTEQPYGFSRFIGDGGTTNTAPYRNYMVLGGIWSIRAEMIHQTQATGTPSDELCKLITICTRYGRNATDAIGSGETLSGWQGHRGVRQANMTALVASGTNRPSSGDAQQVRMSGKFSSKKWFDVKDIKDNLSRLGGSFNDEGSYIPPEEDCFLQLGIFDRIQRGDEVAYVLPNMMIRFKYKAIVLCTETNQLRNVNP
jgi:hypothetical protein